jgi:hypothetical protein
MPQVSWSANARGEYWLDVSLAGRQLQVLIDSGLIDSRGQVGFSIDEALHDSLKQAGGFRSHQLHARLTADGQVSLTESGDLDAQLVCPLTRVPVGPVVHVAVFRGVSGVPNRAGLAFFHRLKGCKVTWDLDRRLWCIEYP